MEKIKTDVLVVGGGLAGLIAALEARTRGLEVIIISKSKVGRSGNTLVSNTFISSLSTTASEEDEELFFQDIIKSGKEINDLNLVEEFVSKSRKITDICEKYGITLKKSDNNYVRKKAPGHTEARSVSTEIHGIKFLSRGLTLTLSLLQKSRELGITIIERAPVVKILTQNQQVCGAVAIKKETGETLVFQVGNIILANGGNGRVFLKTNNTRDITGDAYSLAYEAGAKLRDMEFVQFFPTMMYAPVKVAMSSSLFGEGAVLKNSLGEAFMINYDKAGNMATRDVMTRAIVSEVNAGRGKEDGVYLDCTSISEGTLTTGYKEFYEYIKKARIDLRKEPVLVSPGTHFFMGGIVVNKKGETNIKGLFACGEAVGGLHGANRLGGNALAEAVVFGSLVGENITKVNYVPSVPSFKIKTWQKGDVLIPELRLELQKTMWENSSILRSREGLNKAREKIETLKKEIPRLKLEGISDIIAYYELKSMFDNAELIIKGAILREESRGAHYRTDFPIQDQKFKGNFFYEKTKGQHKIMFKANRL